MLIFAPFFPKGHWATKLEAPWGHFLSQLGVGVHGDVHIRSYVTWGSMVVNYSATWKSWNWFDDYLEIRFCHHDSPIWEFWSGDIVMKFTQIHNPPRFSTGVPQFPAQTSPIHGTLVMAQILKQALCRRMLKDILLLSACSCRFLHLEFWECNLTRVTTSIQKKT